VSKPDLSKIFTLYDEIDELISLKRKGGENLVAEHFKLDMRIAVMKYSIRQSKTIRMTGKITHLGTGSDWHYARILVDPEFRNDIQKNQFAPENEVWIGIADPDEQIEIL
jgi:hypothetical protein